jgi:hypothetical protein
MAMNSMNPAREKLKIEAGTSAQHGWFVQRVRRILWPFIRSYHFFNIDYTEARIQEIQQLVKESLQDKEAIFNETLDQAYGQTRAARAEALAATRISAELRSDSQETKDLAEQLQKVLLETSTKINSVENDMKITTEDLLAKLDSINSRIEALQTSNTGAKRSTIDIGGAVCVQTTFGPLILKPGNLITNHVVEFGGWDVHIIRIAYQARSRGSMAIDVGAHFGVLTCAMADLFSQVHAFEANYENVRYLYANAALRPYSSIKIHNIALYSRNEELSFASYEAQEVEVNNSGKGEEDYYNSSNSGGLMFVANGTGFNPIRAVALDSYGFNNVGFIKIDCQGADGEVIKGALETIARCKPYIVFEWEDKLSKFHHVTFAETKAELDRLGYTTSELYRHNDKQIDYISIPPTN